jgi:isopentenyl-diphosphate delta-isomerase type 1
VKTTDDQSELFIVVDEKDQIVEYRTRGECHHDPDLIHRAVNLFIFNGTGEVLLQKRSLTKDTDPGLWTISVSGHVSRGQSYNEAMQREMGEELGIDIPFIFHSKFLKHYGNTETEMEMLYTAIYDGPFRPDLQEVAEVRFFDRNNLTELIKNGLMEITALLSECLERYADHG